MGRIGRHVTNLMHKHVLPTIMRGDKPPALCNVEPLAATLALAQSGLWCGDRRPVGSCNTQATCDQCDGGT